MTTKQLYKVHEYMDKHVYKYVFTISDKNLDLQFSIQRCECGSVIGRSNSNYNYNASSQCEGASWRRTILTGLKKKHRAQLKSISDKISDVSPDLPWIISAYAINYNNNE